MKLLSALAGCCLACSLLYTTAKPYWDAGMAYRECSAVMRERGGDFTNVDFLYNDGRYRAIYKTDAGRVDVLIEDGQVTIQEGLPLCADVTPLR